MKNSEANSDGYHLVAHYQLDLVSSDDEAFLKGQPMEQTSCRPVDSPFLQSESSECWYYTLLINPPSPPSAPELMAMANNDEAKRDSQSSIAESSASFSTSIDDFNP